MRVERARYFVAAVETGSLRRAAARSGISQPALGEQIGLLEEELDVVLLTRSRSGVRATPAGQALIEPLRRLIAAEDAVRGAAHHSGGAVSGEVAIGTISTLAETVVAPVVGRLREQHPLLRFTVTEAASTAVEAGVASGDLDFGVVTMLAEPAPPTLDRTVLVQTPIGIVVPDDHVLAERDDVRWSDVEAWPVVTMREGTVMWDRLHDAVERPDVVVQAMSARSVKVMVAHRAGVGVLTPLQTSNDVRGLTWVPLRDTPTVDICLVQRRDSQPSAAALTVRRLIAERAAELVGQGTSADRGQHDAQTQQAGDRSDQHRE